MTLSAQTQRFYIDYNEAKARFISQLRFAATRKSDGGIPTHLLNDIEVLEDSLIDRENEDIQEVFYEIDDQCFTLYERVLNYHQ